MQCWRKCNTLFRYLSFEEAWSQFPVKIISYFSFEYELLKVVQELAIGGNLRKIQLLRS